MVAHNDADDDGIQMRISANVTDRFGRL